MENNDVAIFPYIEEIRMGSHKINLKTTFRKLNDDGKWYFVPFVVQYGIPEITDKERLAFTRTAYFISIIIQVSPRAIDQNGVPVCKLCDSQETEYDRISKLIALK